MAKNFNSEKDQELLLLDLSSRAPYGVMVEEFPYVDPVKLLYVDTFRLQYRTDVDEHEHYIFKRADNGDTIALVKPYLCPMSSMTREEEAYWNYHRRMVGDSVCQLGYDNPTFCIFECFEWLNSHHFDYGGLIIKGLALEAPADMYTF